MKEKQVQEITNKLQKKVRANEKLTDNEMTIASLLIHIDSMNKLMIMNTTSCSNKIDRLLEEIGDIF